jgi:DNA-binding response OmpR family regulator
METPGAPKKRKVILVVEDDTSTREMIVKTLSKRYDVHAAVDALEASEKLGSMDPPDLIVCDVMMPKFDGFSFIKRIKAEKEFHNVPVIFLTAKTGPATVVQGIQLGAKHFMSKPFSPMDLLGKIDKLLG